VRGSRKRRSRGRRARAGQDAPSRARHGATSGRSPAPLPDRYTDKFAALFVSPMITFSGAKWTALAIALASPVGGTEFVCSVTRKVAGYCCG
jgi:hypothetical protein